MRHGSDDYEHGTDAVDVGDYAHPDSRVFVIVHHDGTASAETRGQVSDRFDMADCGYMDDAAAILAAGHDGQLQPVTVGTSRRINTDEEFPVRYARSVITTEDGREVGHVTYTDH